MPVEVPLRFACDCCPVVFEIRGGITGVPAVPHKVTLTIPFAPPGWHVSATYVGCPDHPEQRVTPIAAIPRNLLRGVG